MVLPRSWAKWDWLPAKAWMNGWIKQMVLPVLSFFKKQIWVNILEGKKGWLTAWFVCFHFISIFFAATKLANSNLAHLHTVASSESRQVEMSATCQAHLLFGARRPSVQMRSGPFVAAEQHDWLLLFYSLCLCIVYARLCVFVWAHLQFALTLSKTELLSRILREVQQ